MRDRLGRLADRLTHLVAPKATAAAASCWEDGRSCQNCAGSAYRLIRWYLCSDGSAYRAVSRCGSC